MRFLGATALLLGGTLALSRPECFAQHGADLAEFSSCGHHASLTYCLTHLPSGEMAAIESCLSNAGCPRHAAETEARLADERCREFSRAGDLRKRYRALLPRETPAAGADHKVNADSIPKALPTGLLHARDTIQCLITETVSTSTCPVETSAGRLKTLSCFPTEVAKSRCAPGLMCSMDASGGTVCLRMHNTLDIGGIIISIIFGVAIVVGVSALTFMCCKERRYQKKLEARAEATALARAQTKKQRAADARAPLMRQDGGNGGGDPFHDRNRP